jgi:hypothetical protein
VRWCGYRSLLCGALVVAAGLTGVTGCSAGAHNGLGDKSATSSARPAAAPDGPGSAPSGAIGLSPTGVTTRIEVPANSTEEEYFQACRAAKVWMDAQPKTGASLFEPYLAMLQASPSGTEGTWNAPWATLSLARQAAVIVAVRAAANDECG